jgi:hypothetical protein
MRFLLLPLGLMLSGATVISGASAQTLGDVGAASSISGSMSGAGQGGTMAVGARAGRDVRRMGQTPYIGGGNAFNREMMGEGGGAAPRQSAYPPNYSPSGVPGAGPGGGGPNAPAPSGAMGAGGGPSFPDQPGAAGAVAEPVFPRKTPIRWGKETGEGFLAELRSRPTGARGTGRKPAGSTSRASRLSPKQLARLPRQTRSRVIASKYKKPPVGYLSYYLPEDRYKLTSGLWRYVTIEDDRARYPVRYYFRPDSPRFLSIVSQKPRGTQARYNRVIGFASWQDALIAGYRPDPVSKPSPGIELTNIAAMAPREDAAHYAEFLYAGQISPEEFQRTYAYILRVRRTINSRADTRRYLRPTIGQVLRAALGEGTVPRSVGGPPRAVVTTMVQQSQYSGPAGGPPPRHARSIRPVVVGDRPTVGGTAPPST